LIINYADFGTRTLAPGVYKAATAICLTGTLILDGGRADDPKWTIYIHGAFTTLASSMAKFSPGTVGTVHWVVNGAVTIGANSQMVGSITTDAAMTVAAGDDNIFLRFLMSHFYSITTFGWKLGRQIAKEWKWFLVRPCFVSHLVASTPFCEFGWISTL
jgi:hypothetical protein